MHWVKIDTKQVFIESKLFSVNFESFKHADYILDF